MNPHQATALMLLRAARPGDPEEDLQFHLKATLGHLYCRWTTAEILAIAAAVDAREKAAIDALKDLLSGWKYIRNNHGDLYGVGWDRAQQAGEAALAALTGASS